MHQKNSSHNLMMKIMQKSFFHVFSYERNSFKTCMMKIYVGWNIFNHLKYVCVCVCVCVGVRIIGVFNTWHMWEKNMNLWNDRCCVNFKQPNETNKFVSSMTYFIINKAKHVHKKTWRLLHTFNNMY